jgi:branched-subunit amino acid transport protein
MAAVTYLPRLLPALLINQVSIPRWFETWLKYIPFAALGALIFPGILSVEPEQPFFGLVGGLTALILSYLDLHITLVMGGSILTAYIFGQIYF